MTTNPKCSNCKRYFEPKIKSSGLPYKTCEICRKSNLKNKCEHNRQKIICKDCGGSQICDHSRQKSTCKECGGSKICQHNLIKSQCKKCGGSSICEHNRIKSQCKECAKDNISVINLIVNTFIHCSKVSDKKYNRLDIVNFIDKDFCKLLIEESNYKCSYCDCDLELIHYGESLISIERIDNTIGHIKSNVKIACLKCNRSRVGDK